MVMIASLGFGCAPVAHRWHIGGARLRTLAQDLRAKVYCFYRN